MKAKTVAKHFNRAQEAENSCEIYEFLVRVVKKDQYRMEKAKGLTKAFNTWMWDHKTDFYQAEAQVRQYTAAAATGDGFKWYEVEAGVLGFSSDRGIAFLIPCGEKLPPVIPRLQSFMLLAKVIEDKDPFAEEWHRVQERLSSCRSMDPPNGGDNVIQLFR